MRFILALLLLSLGFLSPRVAIACTAPAIPGLPTLSSLPCADPYTENTPSTPSDGPNATGSPNAAKHDRNSCDADFMNQIYARSYLETNREVMISGLLVTKPDSILEYTCFDQQVRDTAVDGGALFSDSRFWTNGGVFDSVPNPGSTYPTTIDINVFMGDEKLDNSLNALVMNSLNTFVKTNTFDHDFLGGVMSGFNNTIAANVAAAGTACPHMNAVWNFAKCENINDTTFFMRFEELVNPTSPPSSADPRNTIALGAGSCAANFINADLIAVANNNAGTTHLPPTPPPPATPPPDAYSDNAGEYAFKDRLVTYVDFYNSSSCESPIPTGLLVTQVELDYSSDPPTIVRTEEFEEHVCPNPGCFYNQPSDSCEETP